MARGPKTFALLLQCTASVAKSRSLDCHTRMRKFEFTVYLNFKMLPDTNISDRVPTGQ